MIMKSKNRRIWGVWPLPLAGFALLALATIAQAQTFTFTNNDLTLGFRKNNPYTENYEVVVDIGQASSYFNLRKTTIYGGSNEVQRNIVAQVVLG